MICVLPLFHIYALTTILLRQIKAVDQLTYLIDFLKDTLTKEDRTGRGVLAAAYANRGIVHDRDGRYEEALKDYIRALSVDEEAVEGPGVIDKILYEANPSSVRKRAKYLFAQLKKPESERVMRIPEIDAKERMYKPR